MPAFCPHLGANLSYGRVRGDCIKCPFHGWRFTDQGRVASIPCSDRPPRRDLTKPLHVQEIHGQIFVYRPNADSERATPPRRLTT
ncbi:Rieske 2Fe-2S domain-containing protein [Candidatus Rariloculus sp.]|uniref:Rieske 2Fe-2S domain-containing protein n=1 Tax=Candidatus Rariloculus sp. TaxID=3101265 RepID=UPI003D0DA128